MINIQGPPIGGPLQTPQGEGIGLFHRDQVAVHRLTAAQNVDLSVAGSILEDLPNLVGLRFIGATTAVVLGSVLYKGCVALALSFGLSPFDLKLVTAALLLIIIIAGSKGRKVKRRA